MPPNETRDELNLDCTGDFDAISGVHGSAAMCGEELFFNADVNTNVVGLITDCTGDLGTTAGEPDSAAIGGLCNLVSSSGNLQEKGTLPMDMEIFTENVPSGATGGCSCVRKYAVRALRRRCQFRHRHHCTRKVLHSQCGIPLRHHRTSLLRVIRTCRV